MFRKIQFVICASRRDSRRIVKATLLALAAVISSVCTVGIRAQTPAQSGAADRSSASSGPSDFKSRAAKLRETALLRLEPTFSPTPPGPPRDFGRYHWKHGIVTTLFWVGHTPDGKAGLTASAWDPDWVRTFGGFDDPLPAHRKDFLPSTFVPRQNPFYVALPYNDVAGGKTKPEAAIVIPWFKEAFVTDGQSVCQNRWVAVRNAAGKVCYAQWSDCGPFVSDHWQYVFGDDLPKPNLNQGAGLNVSPAVRDFLGLSSTDVTDWKFVDLREVRSGPWETYGDNNPFLHMTGSPLLSSEDGLAPAAASTPPSATPPSGK